MSKKEGIKLQTKQNLIDAFWRLYCEKRIEKITIKDITNKAGYNRGTFYEYFKDVYDVLEHIENSLIPSINELPPITIGSETHGMDMNAFFELYQMNNKYYSVLLGDGGDPSFAGKLKKTIKPMIMQELLKGQDVNSVEMDYILEYTLSAMIGIMSYWSSHKDRLSDTQLHELIDRLMQQGVAKQLSK